MLRFYSILWYLKQYYRVSKLIFFLKFEIYFLMDLFIKKP